MVFSVIIGNEINYKILLLLSTSMLLRNSSEFFIHIRIKVFDAYVRPEFLYFLKINFEK